MEGIIWLALDYVTHVKETFTAQKISSKKALI